MWQVFMTSGYVAAATAVSSWPAANPLKNWSILFLDATTTTTMTCLLGFYYYYHHHRTVQEDRKGTFCRTYIYILDKHGKVFIWINFSKRSEHMCFANACSLFKTFASSSSSQKEVCMPLNSKLIEKGGKGGQCSHLKSQVPPPPPPERKPIG